MVRSTGKSGKAPERLEASVVIRTAPSRALKAFFDGDALGAWWRTARSVTTPRALGVYAVEWEPTVDRDEVLGRLGGVFRATVIQFQPDHGFFLADAYWLPPDSDPIGPTALEVTCTTVAVERDQADDIGPATQVLIVQTGFEDAVRWRRYYDVLSVGWARALGSLKALLEK
jgi:uncharacterized protein YndB with AHSA1/START domain